MNDCPPEGGKNKLSGRLICSVRGYDYSSQAWSWSNATKAAA